MTHDDHSRGEAGTTMSKNVGMEYLVLVEKPYTEEAGVPVQVALLVTATDPYAAVRAVMEEDCPLELEGWLEPGCRAWAVPWLGVTGFTWAEDWKGDAGAPLWYQVPRGAQNLPGEPVGRWSAEHGHPYDYRFVPSTGMEK